MRQIKARLEPVFGPCSCRSSRFCWGNEEPPGCSVFRPASLRHSASRMSSAGSSQPSRGGGTSSQFFLSKKNPAKSSWMPLKVHFHAELVWISLQIHIQRDLCKHARTSDSKIPIWWKVFPKVSPLSSYINTTPVPATKSHVAHPTATHAKWTQNQKQCRSNCVRELLWQQNNKIGQLLWWQNSLWKLCILQWQSQNTYKVELARLQVKIRFFSTTNRIPSQQDRRLLLHNTWKHSCRERVMWHSKSGSDGHCEKSECRRINLFISTSDVKIRLVYGCLLLRQHHRNKGAYQRGNQAAIHSREGVLPSDITMTSTKATRARTPYRTLHFQVPG